MRYDPERHHRQSIRLRDYNYSQEGAYFVTICVQDRRLLFGSIINNEVSLNENGLLAQLMWHQLTERFPGTLLDEYVLMPNHLHGILILPPRQAPEEKHLALGEIVRAFKAVTTHRIRQNGQSDFAWQRNYFEHIVRDEKDLDRIRQYIVNNPVCWADDTDNPEAVTR